MDTDPRLARLEATAEHIQRDVTRIESKVDSLGQALSALSDKTYSRFASLLERIAANSERITAFEGQLAAFEARALKWLIATALAFGSLAFTIAKYVN